MSIIYHITTQAAWDQGQHSGSYKTESLDTEGFIHCSTQGQVVKVGNAFYLEMPDTILLCINETLVKPEIKYEAPIHNDAMGNQERFPHIYGPLNLDAVLKVVQFDRGEDGCYFFPDDAHHLG